jgi:predicted Zn-dependent peptidase
VRIWWKAVPFVHKDEPALDLLTDILEGRTGRLYKGLVLGRQVANQVQASLDVRKYGGIFQVECVVKDGKEPAAVEQAVYEEIEKLQKEKVPPEELQKVKNQAKANAYRRLASPISIAIQLMVYDALGDWKYINTSADQMDAVTAEDLQRVASDYLTRETRTVGIFLRKAGASVEDPEIAKLPPQAQAMVRENLKQIGAETDPAKLQEGIAQMQQMAGQVPPEMKAALDLILKRAQERLSALSSEKK